MKFTSISIPRQSSVKRSFVLNGGQNRTANGQSDRSKWTTSRGGPEYPGQTKPKRTFQVLLVTKWLGRQSLDIRTRSVSDSFSTENQVNVHLF